MNYTTKNQTKANYINLLLCWRERLAGAWGADVVARALAKATCAVGVVNVAQTLRFVLRELCGGWLYSWQDTMQHNYNIIEIDKNAVFNAKRAAFY